MISLSPDPSPLIISAVITTLILRQIISATFHVYPGWSTCCVYVLGCFAIPILLPMNGLIIGAGTIFLAVRWVNRRDDPRFVKTPAPNSMGPPESN